MFFVLSKVLGFFAAPSNLLVFLGILGLLLVPTRFARSGSRLAFISLVGLAVFGLSPVGNALIIPLEHRFPPWIPGNEAPDGIIVLGGAITADVSSARKQVALNEAAERTTVIAELARRFPTARILFSGGSSAMLQQEEPEAEFALRLFESFGIARERVLMESRSRNTIENAVFAKAMVTPAADERWLLVSSAFHLPRAVGVFRKAGFAVEPYPVDFRTRGVDDFWRPFPTVAEGLRRTDVAVREWLGLPIYWIIGRSSELFPAPER